MEDQPPAKRERDDDDDKKRKVEGASGGDDDDRTTPDPKRRRVEDLEEAVEDDTTSPSPLIPPIDADRFKGNVVQTGDVGYAGSRDQYATSGLFSNTNPAAIIYAKLTPDHEDIVNAIDYATKNGLAIAVRSGGHQYLGFSSTSGNNIQIDMSNYTQWDDSNVPKDKGSRLILGPAWRLSELHEKCRALKIFFPHGECAGVAVGGHCQTGGYSLFSHSFGMFIDYILCFEIITADKQVRKITRPDKNQPKEQNDDLWFSVLGGSPGNFGIVTRLEIEVKHDDDYPNSKALFRFLSMKKDTIEQLLDIFEYTNDDKELSSNIEYSVMVLSQGSLHRYKFELDQKDTPSTESEIGEIIDKMPNFFVRGILPALVIVMAANTGVDTTESGKKTSDEWFEKVCKKVGEIEKKTTTMQLRIINYFMGLTGKEHIPLSDLDYKCSWRFDREFMLPFQKRVFHGMAQNLNERGFAKWSADQCWKIEGPNQKLGEKTGLKLGCQFITGGCKGSKQGPSEFPTALGNRVPYASMSAFDYFYRTRDNKGNVWPEPFENGKKWLDTEEESVSKTATGPNGKFTDIEHRFLYAPWGPKTEPWSSNVNLDSDEMISYFFTSKEDYERVHKTKM